VDSLLKFLKPYHPSLPLSVKSLKETPRSVDVKLLNNGQYAHLGLQQGLLIKSEKGFAHRVDKVLIDVFVDGVKIYNSVREESWPIMARGVDFKNSKPFVVGIFYGASKPDPIEEYLRDYMDEMKDLLANGITILGRCYEFEVRFYLGDAPARAYSKKTSGHTSKAGCERCDQEGGYEDNTVTYSTTVGAERTDDSFNKSEGC